MLNYGLGNFSQLAIYRRYNNNTTNSTRPLGLTNSRHAAMYTCSKCRRVAPRRFFFTPCRHSLCPVCATYILFSGDNFLCCCSPSCPVCKSTSDIDVETIGGESHRVVEQPLNDD